jgi:coenzyme F420-reducing hydrogenase alpha subunit
MTDNQRGEHREMVINVPVLARVEGEGALDLRIVSGELTECLLRIYEPPRLFERLLVGREFNEVPDVVARICGICPVAYQMSAVHAIEQAFGIDPGPWIRAMRRVLYCGEWIESHALHIHLLAAPDFFACGSVIELAAKQPDEVRRGLRLQELGNDLIRLLGGRAVHPVGVCPGGFYRAPTIGEVDTLRKRLHDALADAEALVEWTCSLELPVTSQSFNSVALRHSDEYPMNQGRLVSSIGLDISIENYPEYFREEHLGHSTALYSRHYPDGAAARDGDGQAYLVGPLARLNLNLDRMPAAVRAVTERCGIQFPTNNMFHSIVGRAVEILYAIHEAARLLDDYRVPVHPAVPVVPRAGEGYGATEAPRGLLWHHYEFDAAGHVRQAVIVPPTSQNQALIEQDLRTSLAEFGLDRQADELRQFAETVIRNYDPCISCATHFLRLKVRRE